MGFFKLGVEVIGVRVRSLLSALAFLVFGFGFANSYGFYLTGDFDGVNGVGAFYQVSDPLYVNATYYSQSGVSGIAFGVSYHFVDVPLQEVLEDSEIPPIDAYLGASLAAGFFTSSVVNGFAVGVDGFMGSRLWVSDRMAVFLEFGLGPSIAFYSGGSSTKFSETIAVGVQLK